MRIFFIIILFFAGTIAKATDKNKLDSLLIHRDFFALQRELQSGACAGLPGFRKLYYQAFVHNFFHHLAASNNEITILLNKYQKELTEEEIMHLLIKKINNHVKLYQYKQAHVTTQLLLSKYKNILSDEDREDVRNSDIIWKGLEHIPPQTTYIANDTRIPCWRDRAALINIPVRFAGSTFDFVFDTGANLSVISESYARKTKLKILNARFKVRAVTGIEVIANLGVAGSLRLGGIIVHNAVFMIFPDSALSLANGVYTINGILGFPIIEQLQEIHINKTFMRVPRIPADRRIRNFGVDELLPVISIAYQTDTLAFTFDTGAQFTFLNEPFYQRYKTLIDTNAHPFDMHLRGAGGLGKSKAYLLPEITINIAGQPAILKDVSVKTESASPKDKLYYGNVGQDIMNQFQEMIISFRYMYVDFVK